MKRYFFMGFCSILTLIVVFAAPVAVAKNLSFKSKAQSPEQTSSSKAKVPLGLSIDRAMERNAKEAKLLIQKALEASSGDNAALNLRLAQLAFSQNDTVEGRKALALVLDSPLAKNTALMADLYKKLSLTERQWLAPKLVAKGFLEPMPKSSCPFFELERRQERAELLSLLAASTSVSEENLQKIWRELYIVLPEAKGLQEFAKHEKFASWQASLSTKEVLERINNLQLFGKNKEAKESCDLARNNSELGNDAQCALAYESAKIERKMRRYQEARKHFQELAMRCDSEIRIKSRYMDLQLAALSNDKKAYEKFDQFVADYPTHGFSDDILMFKTNLLLDSCEKEQALKSLDRIIQEFPTGDMIERALFVKSIIYADIGKTSEALLALNKLKTISSAGSLRNAQAQYWIARLNIWSDLRVLKSRPKNISQSKTQLLSLVESSTPSIYSWLAYLLLTELKVKPTQIKPAKKSLSTFLKKISNPSLKYINELIELGFFREAVALLNESELGDKNANLGAIAELYIKAGKPEAGHQKLIRCNASVALDLKNRAPGSFEQISWPKPFAAEVKHASMQVDVPLPIIYSVMRQESCFLPDAHSWAQARGLMQLMEATAKEHAPRFGIKKLEAQDLFDPKLNLLLGASVFFNYWQRFARNAAVALSAYNAGPNNARKWFLAHQGQPLDIYLEEIPFSETQDYVKNVLAAIFHYAARDGLKHLPPLELRLGSAP